MEKVHHIEMIREGQMNIFEAAYQQQKEEASTMLQQALDKLKTEMDKQKSPYVQVVGNFLTDFLNNNTSEAGKVTVDGKTITGSLSEMQKEAAKHKVGNCAVLTDEQGFAIVLKYFDMQGTVPLAPSPASIAIEAARQVNIPPPTTAPAPAAVSRKKIKASLDAFL